MKYVPKLIPPNRVPASCVSAALIASCLGLACSSAGDPSTSTDPQNGSYNGPGTLLASVNIGNGNVVQFVETPTGDVVTTYSGPVNAPKVDDSLLVGRSVSDIYRDLAGTEPPQALTDAEKRHASIPIGSGATDEKDLAPAQEATSQDRSGLSAVADQWSDQLAKFQNENCNGVGTSKGTTWDQGWCPVNVGWAHSGWGPSQKAYMACGATNDGPATIWVDKWVNGAWQRQWSFDIRPWNIVCYPGVGVGQYRSGIDSAGAAVHFSERYRYAIPTISQVLPNFPDDRNYANFPDNPQGLTHDYNNWYMTRYDNDPLTCQYAKRGYLGKMALVGSSSDPLRPLYYGPPTSYYWTQLDFVPHFGDLVQVNGLLYVGVDNGHGRNAGVAVFNTNLQYIGYGALQYWDNGGDNLGGIAYNARDGLFYAMKDNSHVWGYAISVSGTTVTATRQRIVNLNDGTTTVAMPMTDGTGNGGKATAYGNLYWSGGKGGDNLGIYAIDLITGYVQWYYRFGKGSASEFEGLDIYDTDADSRFGAYKQGQIHLMEIDVDCGTADEYWLAHARVNDPAHL